MVDEQTLIAASATLRRRDTQRRHLLQQPRQFDGFGVVVVAAGFHRLLAIAGHRVRRQRDDRDVLRRGVGFDRARGFPAVHHRQAHVHQHDVGQLGLRLRNAFGAVDREHHDEAAPLQPPRQHVAIRLVVFDEQDLGHRNQLLRVFVRSEFGVGSASATTLGNVTVNVEPAPATDSTAMSPPIIRQNSRDSARPRPVPPYLRDVCASACENASNNRASCASVMPMPVSRIANVYVAGSACRRTVNVIVPPSVNFAAFDSRLNSTCRTFTRSACITPISLGQSITNALRFFSTTGRTIDSASFTKVATSKSSRYIVMRPASTFDRSRSTAIGAIGMCSGSFFYSFSLILLCLDGVAPAELAGRADHLRLVNHGHDRSPEIRFQFGLSDRDNRLDIQRVLKSVAVRPHSKIEIVLKRKADKRCDRICELFRKFLSFIPRVSPPVGRCRRRALRG